MGTASSAGLQAVAKVRSMREQDSRFGLQQAMLEARAHRHRVGELDGRLGDMADAARSNASTFLATRSMMLALGSAVASARQTASLSETLAMGALTHWQHDKVQLRAIELLQERREQEAREEATRREARELDETATQLWRRNHQEGAR